jgi:mannosylfructose-phosphate synthase
MPVKYSGTIMMLSTHGYVAARPQLGLPDTGGQVVFVLELAKQFRRMGYRVDVVTRRFEKQPQIDAIGDGLRVLRIPYGGREFIRKEDMHDHLEDFVQNFTNYAIEQDLRYDIINSHYWDAGWAGQELADQWRIPHIHTPHSLGWWKKKTMQDAGKAVDTDYRFPERIRKEFLIYRNCDHLIATTPQQEEILRQHYDVKKERITMIPPGMDEEKYTPISAGALEQVRKRLKFRPHDVYAVGRIAPNKGYDLLIRALPHLKKLVPGARLMLAVGANSELDNRRIDKLREVAREQKVVHDVHFLGYVPDEQMADYYRAGAVFALCSRYEPFGMTAIEAMACGTPTVLTIHGGLHEAVDFGVHALYADPKKPSEFATALAMPMLYPELRTSLSRRGARLARREFGWASIARQTLRVFARFEKLMEPEAVDDESIGEE